MSLSSLPAVEQADSLILLAQLASNHPSHKMDEKSSNIRKRRRKESKDDVNNGMVFADGDDHDSSEKRRGRVKTRALNEIVTSLFLEERVKCGQKEEEGAKTHRDEKELFDANHRKKRKARLDCNSVFQDYCEDKDCLYGLRRRKSSRVNDTAALAPAAVKVADGENKSEKSGGGKECRQQKRLWVKNRDKAWWDQWNSAEFPEEEFKKAFRMGKDTFELVCSELNSEVAKENTMLRDAVPVRKRVAVCIWRLATGDPLRNVSKKFGLGISTCHKLVLEVCSAIWKVLMPKFLIWPEGESLNEIKDVFGTMSGIPDVVGSMYTTHVPIIAPKISVAAYFNRHHTERNQRSSYSITVQGVVDPKGLFTDVCIGWPGSMSDDQILEKSTLCQRANGGLLNEMWVVGTSGFPLMDFILVPYTQQHLTWTQHAFNQKIEEIQRVAKEAFARLKGRWCFLQKRTEVKLQDLPVVLGACCILHNICEIRNEEMDPELKRELIDDEMVPEIALRSVSARKARDAIAHNLLHHNYAGTSFLS